MIELRTLGSLDLIAPARPGALDVLGQPKRYAVLVYLSLSAPNGFVRRDTLLALFWPEADQARGRNVLRQTVYQLRQSLGAETIRSRGDEELSVDPAALACDVTRFEKLLGEGKPAEALELYRGDFLTGFHVPDAAPELEEWMQSEARRLRALATTAAWSLAQTEEQRGNAGGAVYWSRRVLTLDPLNEKRLVEAMQMLARVGDRAGALHVYHEHARRAEAELGMAPAGEVENLAEELRNAPPVSANGIVDKGSFERPVATASAPPPVIAPVTRRYSRQRRILAWSLPAIAVTALSAVLWQRAYPPAAQRQPVIAIGRITDATVPAAEQQSSVAADLLSTSLARLQGVHVVPLARVTDVQAELRAAGRPRTSMLAAAQQLGAAYLIEGSLHAAPAGAIQLDLQLLDARNGSVARVQRASGNDLFSAIDQATTSIALAFDVRSPREPITQVTTTSLVAYRLYDQGLQAYYADDLQAAYRLFAAALAEDSSFAMAAYYAGISTLSVRDRNALLERAALLANRTTDRERLLITEGVAVVGMSASAIPLADTMAVRYPLDPDAQFVFGHVLLRRGEFLAAARQYRRVIAMDSLSLHRNARCLACDAYGHLAWSLLLADSAGAAARVLREFATVRPGGTSFSGLAMALAHEGRLAEARAAAQAADSVRKTVDEFFAATLDMREGSFGEVDARLQRLLHEGNQQVREQAEWYLVLSLRSQGRFQEALRLAGKQPGSVAGPIVMSDMGSPRAAASAFQALVGFMDTVSLPGHRAKHQAWLLTHVANSLAAAGDTSRLQQLADSVDQIGQLSALGRDLRLHHYIRGLLWKARQQPARAADEFRRSIWSWSEGYTRANYELARLLIALNKPAEARYPLQSALRGDLESSNLYVSRTELHELLAQTFDALGQRDSAAVHYRQVVNAWSRCDSTLLPRLYAARARLQALNNNPVTTNQ